MSGTSLGIYQTCEQGFVAGEQSIFEQSSTQNFPLGTVRRLADGRMFRYSKAGASNITQAQLLQSSAPVAYHLNMVATAGNIGDQTLTATDGGTAFTANQYAEGFLHVNNATGEGYTYKIKSHPANAGSATCVFTLYDPLIAAIDTSSRITVTKNRYDGVIQSTGASPSSPIVGVSPIPVTALYYFWLQTKGPIAVLTCGTVVIANSVTAGSDAGSIAPRTSAADTGVVGNVMRVNATTDESLLDLRLE